MELKSWLGIFWETLEKTFLPIFTVLFKQHTKNDLKNTLWRNNMVPRRLKKFVLSFSNN